MPTDTIPRRLFERARAIPDRPAYCAKRAGSYVPTSWQTYAREVSEVARAMIALGLEPGDFVGILGFNRPEWVIFDLAAMCAGGAPAGIYTTCSSEEVGYILHHSEAKLVLVENRAQYEKVRAQKGSLPELRHIITMKGAEAIDDSMVMSWEAFVAEAKATEVSVVDERVAALEADAVATLIYTSGTTGRPKAVMLSHDNLAWTAEHAADLLSATERDRNLSYLPLSHIAEQMFTIHVPISSGMCVYFAESLEKVAANLTEVHPTIVFGVPRIWEKLYAGIAAKLAEADGVKAALLSWAQSVGRRVYTITCGGGHIGPLLTAQYRLADHLVYDKIKAAVGLDAGRFCVSGAAPIAKDVLDFFTGIDVLIREVYGQSEDSGPTTFNRPGHTKLGTVGPAFPGTEVKIADDGEVLVYGRNVFLGYYKDPEVTAETLVDGWLHSGDLGHIDANGFLSITGRKKEIIVTSGGKNIAPAAIENALKQIPLVSQAVVIGDRRNYLIALLTLEPEAAKRFAAEHNLDAQAALHENRLLLDELHKGVAAVNARLAQVENIRKFRVLPRDFTIADGELTPSLKVKRRVVETAWAEAIDAMYAEAAPT